MCISTMDMLTNKSKVTNVFCFNTEEIGWNFLKNNNWSSILVVTWSLKRRLMQGKIWKKKNLEDVKNRMSEFFIQFYKVNYTKRTRVLV